MSAVGQSSLGTQCSNVALGMASLGLFCGISGSGGSGIYRPPVRYKLSRIDSEIEPVLYENILSAKSVESEIERLEAESLILGFKLQDLNLQLENKSSQIDIIQKIEERISIDKAIDQLLIYIYELKLMLRRRKEEDSIIALLMGDEIQIIRGTIH